MTTNWKIQIDWDRDGDFTAAIDDVTNRVISASWALGMRRPYQDIADAATLNLTLRNNDRHFSPENTGSDLSDKIGPQRPVRVISNDGSQRIMWTGWIQTIAPTVGSRGERLVQITAHGPQPFYRMTQTKLALQENQRTDQIIRRLVEETGVPTPSLYGKAVVGIPGYMELADQPEVSAESDVARLDTGKLTLAYAADNWVRQGGYTNQVNPDYDVYRGIRDITMAERGRFLFDREGYPVFWNRERLQSDTTLKATLDNSMQGMDYVYAGADHLKNEVVVIAHPRTISEDDQEVLWELGDGVIRVKKDGEREVYARYEDDKDTRVGAKDVTVTDLEFEQGSATVEVDERANGANLIFTSTGTVDALVTKAVVRGRKIVDRGRVEAQVQDDASVAQHGRRTLRLNLSSVDNLEEAEYIASYELSRRGTARGIVSSVVLRSHAFNGGNQHASQLDVTLGDRVTINEAQTGHSQTYYVIGESHQLEGKLYATQWYLEPAPLTLPCLLDTSGRNRLGTEAYLGF